MLRDLTFEAMQQTTLHKKWNFPLMISSVNVTKSSGDDAFGQICWKNPWLKTSFFAQRHMSNLIPKIYFRKM